MTYISDPFIFGYLTFVILVVTIYLGHLIRIVLRDWRRRRTEKAWWKSRGAWVPIVFLLLFPSRAFSQAHYRVHGHFVLPDAKYSPGESRKRDIVSAATTATTNTVWHDLLKEEICSPAFRTARYRHTSTALKLQVCTLYGMPWHCWGLRHKVTPMNSTSQNIDPMGNRFEMVRIDTQRIPAKMVEFHADRNSPSINIPEQDVGTHSTKMLSIDSKSGSAVSTRLHRLAQPDPTSRFGVYFDAPEYRLRYWPRHAIFEKALAGTELNAEVFGNKLTAAADTFSSFTLSMAMPEPTSLSTILLVSMPLADESHSTSATNKVKRHNGYIYTKAHNPCQAGCDQDHIISLWLGGADTLKNLYPQPIAQARVKDKLELFLHRQVCAGKMTLDYAQWCLSGDWVACSERELKK